MPHYFDSQPEGSEILHKLQPNLHKSPVIESSARLAERHGDKPGNAAEKIGAFVTRLDDLLEGYRVHRDFGYNDENKAEIFSKLLERHQDNLLLDYEDIPDSYWAQQAALARDNGQDTDLSESRRHELAEQLRDAQETGVKSWTDYLSENNYPMWFNVYALEGMSTLSTFNKNKGSYNKRSAGTVAPYPQLNPASLARVCDAVLDVRSGRKRHTTLHVQRLVEAGNFNKLYSHFLLDSKTILPTPENPEDVHGDWREFDHTDIDGMMEAAQGTPWCIEGRIMAEQYLSLPDSKFYMFFLKDKESGEMSQTACASVRLEYGTVHEISGLKGDSSQFLEDSLVPTVMEKVSELPGGESYFIALEDKQRLIAMDRKFQAGEEFTIDEIKFLYEFDRLIEYVDTYADDPRPKEFKSNMARHLEQIAESLGPNNISRMLENRGQYIQYTNKLLELGMPAGEIAHEIIMYGFARPAEKNQPAASYDNAATLEEVEVFLGALRPGDMIDDLDDAVSMINHGVDARMLVNHLDAGTLSQMVPDLLAHGIAAEEIAKKADWSDEGNFLVQDLCEAGLNPDLILGHLLPAREVTPRDIEDFAGAEHYPDMKKLLYGVSDETAVSYKKFFLAHGVSEEEYKMRIEFI